MTTLYGGDFEFDVCRTQDPAAIDAAVEELMGDPGDYRTLVVDPISVYCDLVQEDYLRVKRVETNNPNAVLKGTDFAPIKGRIRRFVQKLLALDLNIVVTAREKPEYAEGSFMKQVGVLPDMHKEVPHMFDTLIYVYIDEDGRRTAIAHPDIVPGVVAKDRSKLPKEKFEFSYDNLAKYWGLDGLSRKAEAVTTNQAIEETTGRELEVTMSSGAELKTAGITSEQLDEINDKLGDDEDKKKEFKNYLISKYGVGSVLDLREDEATLIISVMK